MPGQLSDRRTRGLLLTWHAAQSLNIISERVATTLTQLGLDVLEELTDSFPEELRQVVLREIKGKRPDPRVRSQAKAAIVRKFIHLTPLERYERAVLHADRVGRIMRLADCMLVGEMLGLADSALQVRRSCVAVLYVSSVDPRLPSSRLT